MDSSRTPGLPELQPTSASSRGGGKRAFTLVELLVVIVVVALLASLMMPALARTRPNSQSVHCLNNHRQLVSAWKMHASDHNDLLLAAGEVVGNRQVWMTGYLDFAGRTENWDPNLNIVTSPLWTYTARQASIFRCPADPTYVMVGGNSRPRVRSVSMSHVFGNGAWLDLNFNSAQSIWRNYDKGAQIMIPAKTFVFLDEHPDSLNDGSFANACTGGGSASARIIDFPGSYHNRGCAFGFADGRAEIHKWLDSRTTPPPRYNNGLPLNVNSPNNKDLLWLAENTTVRR